MEQLLLDAINRGEINEEGMKLLKEEYSEDVDVDALAVELSMLTSFFKNADITCFDDNHKYFLKSPELAALLPNVSIVVFLLLVNPATSASAERSFSLARRLKTW